MLEMLSRVILLVNNEPVGSGEYSFHHLMCY